MLEYAFMQRALAAAIGIGAVCGALGFFVVLRRLAFVGIGLSHAALGGVAVGLLLGWPPLWCGGVFAVAVALGIATLGRHGRLHQDALIGVFFSGAMALGVVLFSLQRGAQQDLFGYLFGDVLAISAGELTALGSLGAAVLLALAVLFRRLLLVAFDDELARAYGHPVAWLEAGLLLMLAATVMIGVRLVGVLLVEALLVVPAATAALWTANWRGQLALSTSFAVASGLGGLALAWYLDLAAGGSIALLTVLLFATSWLVRGRAIPRRR